MGRGNPLGKFTCIPGADDLPAGYTRLEQGNAYLTLNCRKQASEQKRNYYQWTEKGRQIMAFPSRIVHSVKQAERRTRQKRLRAVKHTDSKLRQEFVAAIYAGYPNMPRRERARLADVQMEKGQNRIARSRKVPMDKRVDLAVWAHAWHVKDSGGKKPGEILKQWRGKAKKN